MEDFKTTQKLSFQHKIYKINEIIAHSKPVETKQNENKIFFDLKERKIREKVEMHFSEENKGEEIHLVYDETVERIRNVEEDGQEGVGVKEGFERRKEENIVTNQKKLVTLILIS